MSDAQIRLEILNQLKRDPSIEATHIVVVVDKGAVTISGNVHSHTENLAIEAATRRVQGVTMIKNEIGVQYPSDQGTAGPEIAKRLPRENIM